MSIDFDKHVVKVLADVAIFLEFTNEDLLNPDVAIEVMEQLSAKLQLMSLEEKSSLCSTFYDMNLPEFSRDSIMSKLKSRRPLFRGPPFGAWRETIGT